MKILHNIAMLIIGPLLFGTILGVVVYCLAGLFEIKRSDGNDLDLEAFLKIGRIVMFFIMLFLWLSGRMELL